VDGAEQWKARLAEAVWRTVRTVEWSRPSVESTRCHGVFDVATQTRWRRRGPHSIAELPSVTCHTGSHRCYLLPNTGKRAPL